MTDSRLQVNASSPVVVTARIDLWRTQFVNQTEGDIDDSARGPCDRGDVAGWGGWKAIKVPLWADAVVPRSAALPAGQVGWFHRNRVSQYSYTLRQQMLGALANRTADPLLNRTSGALLVGGGTFTTINGSTIGTTSATQHDLTIVTQTAVTETEAAWLDQIRDVDPRAPRPRQPRGRCMKRGGRRFGSARGSTSRPPTPPPTQRRRR